LTPLLERTGRGVISNIAPPDVLVRILEGEAELLQVAEDGSLVLVQHPVPLLLVLLGLQI
jgi:hypothetical protein